MNSAHKTLIDIASTSQGIINTLDRNIGRKTAESLRLDKIVVGCRTVLEALNKTLVLKDGNADDRLVDWLKSDEPQTCLRTLNQMEEILNKKVEYGVKSFFKASRSTQAQDKNDEAIRLFQMRKSYFHFLLNTGMWNREGDAQLHPQGVSQLDVLDNKTVDGRDLASVTQCRNSIEPPCTTQAGKWSVTDRNHRAKFEKLGGVLEWLDAWKSRGTHDRTVLLRQPDTCTWLLNTDAYKTWRGTENSFLWLHGKPGAGKSVLAAFVIDSLKDNLQDGEVLAYFYCDFRNERSTSAAEVMRSLLSQILRDMHRQMVDPGDLIEALVEDKDEGASTISNAILLARHISRAAGHFSQQPFLVIDALDECKDVDVLLKALDGLRQGGIRLLATSRSHQIIKDSLSASPMIDMEEMRYWISADIRLHVTRELDSRRRLRVVAASLKEKIHSKLCKQADGMFRWVQCQLDTLEHCMTAKDIRKTLDDLPSGLDATYERILLGIDVAKREGKMVRRALNWLVVALRPLQLFEIMEGLSIDLGERAMKRDSGVFHGSALLDVLGSLVVYDGVTDTVILSHFSVKEYLVAETTRIRCSAYHIDQQAAHTRTALLCMCYIGVHLRGSQQSRGHEVKKLHGHSPFLPASRSLLGYALDRGFDHLVYVDPRDQAVLHAIKDLQLDAERHHSEWERLCRHLLIPHRALKHDLLLFILIAFAPELLLRSFIGLDHPRLQPKNGTNPLMYAAYLGKIEHARTLLLTGADVNYRGWDMSGSRQLLPLEVAVERGYRAIVDLFVDEGSQVPRKLFVDALTMKLSFIAARIVSKLLQTDEFAQWATEVQDQETLLGALDQSRYRYTHGLSEEDIDIIEQRLVQLGYKPPPRFDEAAFRYAVYEGHVSTVRRMLLRRVPLPPDIILDASRSKNSNSAMIRIFLDTGCDVSVTSPAGDSPLHLVLQFGSFFSEEDCFESVRLLVDAGCDPSAQNLTGDTPIYLAAMHGYFSTVEYLLSLRVLVPYDILHATSDAALIRLLVRHGADAYAIAPNGDTALHSAMRQSHDDESLDCAGILIDAGCSPRSPNAYGETAFDVVAQAGHFSVLRYLLSINIPLPPGILLSVIRERDASAIPMINFLVDKGADVHATRPDGNTLLHLAMDTNSEVECLERVKILVNVGCDPRACNLRGRTPFHFAVQQGHVYAMEYLLSLGISVPPDVMVTLFEWPYTSYPPIGFLLDKGGDPRTISETGDTLLHLAASVGSEEDALELTRFLVLAGCNPSIRNSENETSFHIAAQSAHITVIDYYLSIGMSLPPDILLVRLFKDPAKVIRYLIEKGASVSATTTNGDTPLHLLATCGVESALPECVQILIHAGCDPHAQNLGGETPLHAAAKYGSTSVLKYLLSQGVLLPDDILRTSAPSLFRFLINKGADARCTAANVDMQLLHHALDCPYEDDCLECAKILVGAGWDPSLRNAANETPIHIAARRGHVSVIQYLLLQSAPLPPDVLFMAVPDDGHSLPIPRVPLIRFLIREGADVNSVTSDGDTLLHLALRSRLILDGDDEYLHMKMWKVVEILLNCGADPSARNADGKTPIDIAEANGHFFKENFLRLVRNTHHVRSNSQ